MSEDTDQGGSVDHAAAKRLMDWRREFPESQLSVTIYQHGDVTCKLESPMTLHGGEVTTIVPWAISATLIRGRQIHFATTAATEWTVANNIALEQAVMSAVEYVGEYAASGETKRTGPPASVELSHGSAGCPTTPNPYDATGK